jgi:hypothetical protein
LDLRAQKEVSFKALVAFVSTNMTTFWYLIVGTTEWIYSALMDALSNTLQQTSTTYIFHGQYL